MVQAYKDKSQSEVDTNSYDKEISRSSNKRTYNAMEEADMANYEGTMDSESEDSQQDGILNNQFYTNVILTFACS